MDPHTTPFAPRALGALGAVLAGAGLALLAYAAHGAEGAGQVRLHTAGLVSALHGVALASLARSARGLALIALFALAAGTVLFAGTLVLAQFTGAGTRLAPVGGSLAMLAWLAYGAHLLRR